MTTPLWFKDAVVYELHIKTFQDSNGDGIGDFRGLLERLDYFSELGITALWLLPFYPSPLRDDGYDIADYFAVHPSYGTVDDFRAFLEEAHRRGIRVITELVLNHTSNQNEWFQRSRHAPVGSPERDFYVWSDDPRKYREARIIFKDFETSNWTWDPVAKSYFWHRFYSHQPDLNFENPLVHEELFRAIDFWLEMGVDGLRLDAVPYLYEREGTNCENLPETHAFLRKLRKHIDDKFTDRMLLAEANQWPEDAAAYFGNGDECHMEFHFPLMPRMFMALQMEDRYPIIDILEQTPTIPAGCQWAIFLRNHDELTLEMVTDEERDYMYRVYAQDPRARINLGIRRRLAPLLGNNRRRIELINSLLFSLPGTPIIYYGDEIGMGDNFYLGDRNGVRTPMQWSADRNAGFSKGNPQQLYLPTIIDPEYHYESVNVENQQKNVSSLFWWMRRMLAVRQNWVAFSQGTIEFFQPDNAKILAYARRFEEQTVLVIANLSRFVQVAELDLSAYAGLVPEELIGHSVFPEIGQTPQVYTLAPHGFYWLALRPATALRKGEIKWDAPAVTREAIWNPSFVRRLEKEFLPAYIPVCRWFGGKGRKVREMHVLEDVPVKLESGVAHLLAVEVAFADGLLDTYLLPVAFEQETRLMELGSDGSVALIVKLANQQVLCDALYLPEFRTALLKLMLERGATDGRTRLVGDSVITPEPALLERALAGSRLVSAEQSNTSINYADIWFFKFYRKFEHGMNPDCELTKYLNGKLSFTPTYTGALRLVDSKAEGIVGMLVGYTQNQGDGWSYSLDSVKRYFERVLEARVEFNEAAALELIGGVYTERARQLGFRTAELHLALNAGEALPEFAPELFSTLYQRSLYQSMRGSASSVLRQLRKQLSQLPEEIQADVSALLANQTQLFDAFSGLLSHKMDATKIRIHGDYHLGQVLNTGKDFAIIDFEGEPKLALSERRLKRSPLRDVAGMLRSFDYVASHALSMDRQDDRITLEPWAQAWVETVSKSFLDAYFEGCGEASFLPATSEDTRVLLEAFQLSKAVYELGYELSYRPAFIPIPLRAVQRLLNARKPATEPPNPAAAEL
ncbi:MAG: treS [Chthoniobacteraceae bacterium]|nr:treS [Chthoniobacteraceae bacterium]